MGNQVTWSITLNLTWNIFDRFLTRYAVAAARTQWENTKVDHVDSQLQAAADVRISHSDYLIAQQQLQTANVGVKAAQEAYDAIVGRYQVGGASFIDVLTSQVTLVQAQFNQAQAVVNLKLREKTLEYSVGILMP